MATNIVANDWWKIVKTINWSMVAWAVFIVTGGVLLSDALSDWAGASAWRCERMVALPLFVLCAVFIRVQVARCGWHLYLKVTFEKRMISYLNEDSKKVIRARYEKGYGSLSGESPTLVSLVQNKYIQIGKRTDSCGYFSFSLNSWLERWIKNHPDEFAQFPEEDDDEYYATLLHYVADLAQPLHVSIYDDFNRSFHFVSDDILSDTEAVYPVFAAVSLADELTVDDTLVFETEEQLLEAVIALAARSQKLAGTMRAEQRNITREEALLQVSQAASLGRAVMKYCGKELVGDNEAEAADLVLYGTVYTAEDETDGFANNRNTGTP